MQVPLNFFKHKHKGTDKVFQGPKQKIYNFIQQVIIYYYYLLINNFTPAA